MSECKMIHQHFITPPLRERKKGFDDEELHNESSDRTVPPTVNNAVKLRLHITWQSFFTVADMIRVPVLYKLKKNQFLTDTEKSSLLASLFDACVKYT